MSTAIQGFNPLRTTHEETTYAEGYEAGQYWAENLAEDSQLERLLEFVEGPDFDNFFVEDSGAPFSSGERLAFIIEGEDPDRWVSNEFWNTIQSSKRYDPNYSEGFTEGAI